MRPRPKSFDEALARSRRGEKFFVLVDDPSGALNGARRRLGSHQRVEGDRALAERLGIRGPAIVVVANGRASVAQNIRANEIQRGRRLLPAGRFRPLAQPQSRDGFERTKRCSGPGCPPGPTPAAPRGGGVSMRQAPGVRENLRALTRQWTPSGRRADGSLIPSALTGPNQRRATAALLGVPASQVSDAMIQNLFARVTQPSGALRADAAARMPRRPQPAPRASTRPQPTTNDSSPAKRAAELVAEAARAAASAVGAPEREPVCTGDS